jgi:hypothetical protein
MNAGRPNPGSTLAFVLGSSRWMYIPRFQEARSFANSASRIVDWLCADKGLALPIRNVKDLFGSFDDASEILAEAARFVNERRAECQEAGRPVTDLIFYYIGHGDFHANEFYLTVRRTRDDDPLISSITAKALGNWVRRACKGLRTYLVLDCCFAASIQTGFMSSPLGVAELQLADMLPTDLELGARPGDAIPEYGVALLAAAGPREAAQAPDGSELTMFSGALIEVLESGSAGLPEALSLSDLHYLVAGKIEATFGARGVRPEIRPLVQRQGRVELVPLFPNWTGIASRQRARQLAADRQKAEAERQAEAELMATAKTAQLQAQPKSDAADSGVAMRRLEEATREKVRQARQAQQEQEKRLALQREALQQEARKAAEQAQIARLAEAAEREANRVAEEERAAEAARQAEMRPRADETRTVEPGQPAAESGTAGAEVVDSNPEAPPLAEKGVKAARSFYVFGGITIAAVAVLVLLANPDRSGPVGDIGKDVPNEPPAQWVSWPANNLQPMTVGNYDVVGPLVSMSAAQETINSARSSLHRNFSMCSAVGDSWRVVYGSGLSADEALTIESTSRTSGFDATKVLREAMPSPRRNRYGAFSTCPDAR